jgi:glycosyltransferase involved in cell wall biosynthesis
VRISSFTTGFYSRHVRIVLLDPAAYTLPYEHQLARALVAGGAEVEVVASRFRFGAAPEPDGYRRRELFYPLSARLFRRSRLRLPLKAAEHPIGLLRLRGLQRDVLHVQWAPLPELDVRLMPAGPHAVFTAHDILPRRTASKRELWRRLYARFARVVVHSEHGRGRLVAELGVPADRLALIAHPVFPGTVQRRDDGRTLLFFGLIQRYKQLDHAIEVARRLSARLIVAGDPMVAVDRRSHPEVEWRLGYQSDEQLDAALAETTVALFPYRPELDQSGALLRALGSGVAVAAYDVGGVAEPVKRFGAGAVAPSDDLDALTEAVRRLLGDEEALAAAREGALRARAELTWDAAAAAHLDLYRSL